MHSHGLFDCVPGTLCTPLQTSVADLSSFLPWPHSAHALGVTQVCLLPLGFMRSWLHEDPPRGVFIYLFSLQPCYILSGSGCMRSGFLLLSLQHALKLRSERREQSKPNN